MDLRCCYLGKNSSTDHITITLVKWHFVSSCDMNFKLCVKAIYIFHSVHNISVIFCVLSTSKIYLIAIKFELYFSTYISL